MPQNILVCQLTCFCCNYKLLRQINLWKQYFFTCDLHGLEHDLETQDWQWHPPTWALIPHGFVLLTNDAITNNVKALADQLQHLRLYQDGYRFVTVCTQGDFIVQPGVGRQISWIRQKVTGLKSWSLPQHLAVLQSISPLYITYSIINGQFLSYHAYMEWEIKAP